MADLDAEFALFQAELASLEEVKEVEETKEDTATSKRAREEDESVQQPPSKVKKSEPVVVVASAPVVIAAKPKIYSAPPRPVPVRNEPVETSSQYGDDSAYAASSGGALSGFPEGTSGEYAAYAGAAGVAKRGSQLPINRLDMATGGLLSAEESQLMNMQQSVYEYDPSKAARAKLAGSNGADGKGGKQKKNLRMAGGDVWEDQTLADWPDNDFRLFIGDLGNEVNDEILCHAFSRYSSFQRARVVRDKHTHKTKGFGFVSFSDPFDCAKALREMNGKYIGNRPVKIQKSKWEERNIDVARKKAKKKSKHHLFG